MKRNVRLLISILLFVCMHTQAQPELSYYFGINSSRRAHERGYEIDKESCHGFFDNAIPISFYYYETDSELTIQTMSLHDLNVNDSLYSQNDTLYHYFSHDTILQSQKQLIFSKDGSAYTPKFSSELERENYVENVYEYEAEYWNFVLNYSFYFNFNPLFRYYYFQQPKKTLQRKYEIVHGNCTMDSLFDRDQYIELLWSETHVNDSTIGYIGRLQPSFDDVLPEFYLEFYIWKNNNNENLEFREVDFFQKVHGHNSSNNNFVFDCMADQAQLLDDYKNFDFFKKFAFETELSRKAQAIEELLLLKFKNL